MSKNSYKLFNGDKMERFNSRQAMYQYKHHFNSTPEEIFPLLCFNREYEWIDGWSAKMIHSESGYMEKGCIFISYLSYTGYSPQLSGGKEMVWVVNTHDIENYLIEATNFVSGLFVLKFSIKLIDNKDGSTTAIFTHKYSGISETGNEIIEKVQTEEAYIKQQQFLEKSMNYFLENKKMLKFEIH
jgi:hypothetical protein